MMPACQNVCPRFAKFSALVTYGRGSGLLWRCCDTLCTSGFVDCAMFANDRPGTWILQTVYCCF